MDLPLKHLTINALGYEKRTDKATFYWCYFTEYQIFRWIFERIVKCIKIGEEPLLLTDYTLKVPVKE